LSANSCNWFKLFFWWQYRDGVTEARSSNNLITVYACVLVDPRISQSELFSSKKWPKFKFCKTSYFCSYFFSKRFTHIWVNFWVHILWPAYKSNWKIFAQNLSKISRLIRKYIRYFFACYFFANNYSFRIKQFT